MDKTGDDVTSDLSSGLLKWIYIHLSSPEDVPSTLNIGVIAF